GARGAIAIELVDRRIACAALACLLGALLRLVALLRRRLLHRIPATIVVLLPAVAGVAVDVSVAAGVDVAAAGARDAGIPARSAARDRLAAAASARRTRCRTSGAIGHARGLRPLVAALNRGRAPAPVAAGARLRARVRPGARVVRFGDAARAIWTPGCRPSRVCPRPRVVTRGHAGAAVRSVPRRTATVDAGPRVVP